MGITIQILGLPTVVGAGRSQPRGNKVWALLALLLLAGTPQPRRLVARILFPEADDPLMALRWNISQLRQLLGADAAVEGDPLSLRLPPASIVDTDVLLRGSWIEAVRLPGLGRELLEGLHFDTAPGFELWLANERSRLGAASEAILHEAALASLARRDYRTAVRFATTLVSLNPYDENSHVILARAMLASGDLEGARRHVERTVRLFREELGLNLSQAFSTAALSAPAATLQMPSPPAVVAQIESGEAAIAAGAWSSGLQRLRSASAAAVHLGDPDIEAQAHLSLGSALVHAARGLDEEGAAALHRAAELFVSGGASEAAATAKRELAYVELLRGRYERAMSWLAEADALAAPESEESAWIAAVRGVCETDVASYHKAQSWLKLAMARADAAGANVPGSFASAFLGRAYLLRGEIAGARQHLTRALELARAASWTAFVPLPMSFLAEAELMSGDLDLAAATFEHAFALSCELEDPCWESVGARGLGLVAAARGDIDSAMARLEEAPRLCRRFPDSYLWVEAYALEGMCRVAVESRAPIAPAMVTELETISSRAGMKELLAQAMLHRASLGDRTALDLAESLVLSIDNPVLTAKLDQAQG